jgi:O-antigen/teichoic acid export membrane protein
VGGPILRRAAIRLAIATGGITAAVSLLASLVFLFAVNDLYLFPYVVLVCLFLPFEHIQLIVSGVDRGTNQFARYNMNRLAFAITFPAAVLFVFGLGINQWIPNYDLAWVCALFVASRIVGLWPTLRSLQADFSSTSPSELSGIDGGRMPSSADGGDLHVSALLKKGRGYAWSMFATEFFERLDILLIIAIASMEQAGHYFVAIPAAALVTILPNSLGILAFNAGANANFHVPKFQAIAILIAALAIQAITAWLLYLILPTLILFFFGERFEPAILFAIWLLPACALKGYLQFADGFLKGRGRAYVGVIARILSVGVMLVSFAAMFGMLDLYSVPAAAAVGQLCSAIIISIVVVQVANRNNKPASLLEEGIGT